MAINIKPENRGKFTASAKRAGMGVQAFARKVLANKGNYSSTQVKRANFARNASKWNKENGGEVSDKISLLVKEGYPQKQAVAIALSMKDRGDLGYGGYIKKKKEYGGNVEDFKQYDTGSHMTGDDQMVDATGTPNNINPVASVQNNENSYQGYVYSDKLINPRTGNKFSEDMTKLVMKNKRADLDEPTKNRLDFEAARLAKLNEGSRELVESVDKFQMQMGGPLPMALNVALRLFNKNRKTEPLASPELKPFELPTRELPVNNVSPVVPKEFNATNPILSAVIGKGLELVGKSALATLGDNTGEAPVVNPNEQRIEELMASRTVDNAAVRNEVLSNMQAALTTNRSSTRSQGVLNALNANTFSRAQQNLSKAELESQGMNNQYRAEQAQVLDTLGREDVSATNIANQIKSQNIAARADAVQGILESAGNAGEFGTRVMNARISTNEKISLLRSIYPNYTINATNWQEFLNAVMSGADLTKFQPNA